MVTRERKLPMREETRRGEEEDFLLQKRHKREREERGSKVSAAKRDCRMCVTTSWKDRTGHASLSCLSLTTDLLLHPVAFFIWHGWIVL